MAKRYAHILSEIVDVDFIGPGPRAYLEHRLQNRFYSLFLREFARQEKAGLITRAQLAKRLGMSIAQITQHLGGDGNWTAGTLSGLLAGMGMELGPLTCVRLADCVAK